MARVARVGATWRILRTAQTLGWSTLLLALAAFADPAWAQRDIEPNNACAQAQDAGALFNRLGFGGGLRPGDVDYFAFSAAPGSHWMVRLRGTELGEGVLPVPALGIFDSACNQLGASFFEPELELTVPADGIALLVASSQDDREFNGGHVETGGYVISVDAAIGAISGRVVDAVTGEPLSGIQNTARVLLIHCETEICSHFEFIDSIPTDSNGRFRFGPGPGRPFLAEGWYQLTAVAEDYDPVARQFFVEASRVVDLGDVPLAPPPIQLTDVRACEALPPQGGRCRFSARVHNHTASALRILGRSIILAEWEDFETTFEASVSPFPVLLRRASVAIQPGASAVLEFEFEVPSFVPQGGSFCSSLHLGVDPSPVLNVLKQEDIFCFSREGLHWSFYGLGRADAPARIEMLRTRLHAR